MNEHRNYLAEQFRDCSPQEKSLFAFLCAERLRACC